MGSPQAETRETEGPDHVRSCNKRHAHQAPGCCSSECWCHDMPWEEIEVIVRKIEDAARNESYFSDEKVTGFAAKIFFAFGRNPCQDTLWEEIKDLVGEIEDAGRHEADFSDKKVNHFAEKILSAFEKHT